MRLYGLIGYPLSHSFSQKYFTEKFEKEGIKDCSYQNFPIADIGEVENIIDRYPELAGLNITIPYKEKITPLFRQILRALNKTFYHQTVTTKQVEDYFSKMAKKDLSKIFDQYLRTTTIPDLEYKITGDKISYRWNNCVKGFAMPVMLDDTNKTWLYPTTQWKSVTATAQLLNDGIKPDRNFYIHVKKL